MVLDKKTKKVFDFIDKNPKAFWSEIQSSIGEPIDSEINFLLSEEIIERVYRCNDPLNSFVISAKGNTMVSTKHKEDIQGAVRYWIPIAISNLIAIAALMVSIFK